MRKAVWIAMGLVVTLAGVARGEGARVEQFTPTGVIKNVRQVTARFSEAMIPFGDPRPKASPFEIDCAEKGAERWVDSTHWVYDFERDVPAGVRCEFTLKSQVQSLTGRDLAGAHTFIFSTGGPAIRTAQPYEGSTSIVEDQAFILALDAEPTLDSVENNVYFVVEGISEKVGVNFIKGATRDRILKSHHSYGEKIPKERLLIVQAKQRFPENAKVRLVWGRGVSAKSGVTTDDDQVLEYQVRKPFTAEFSCRRENAESGCTPFSSMELWFSGDIAFEKAKQITLKTVDGKSIKQHTTQGDNPEYINNVRFDGPFPEDTDFVISLPAGIVDESNRSLANAESFPLKVRTDRFPPLAKFAAPFGILEYQADAEALLPLTVRRVEPELKALLMDAKKNQGVRLPEPEEAVSGKRLRVEAKNGNDVLYWLKQVDTAQREQSIFGTTDSKAQLDLFQVPKSNSQDLVEVVGIPFKRPGFYVLELESPLLGKALLKDKETMYVPTAVLVTNLAVHFKWGRESSIAWVTQLNTGKPVEGAEVTVRNCRGEPLWLSKTDRDGIARLEKLPSRFEGPQCSSSHVLDTGLLVTAKLGDDFSFVHSSWDKGIESWRFQVPTEYYENQNVLSHTIFDQTLFRAGETVHMKHVWRKHTTSGFALVAANALPKVATIQSMGSDQKFKLPLKWRADGTSESTWAIPKEGKLGTYTVTLSDGADRGYGASSGYFRVEEYRVPLMKASLVSPSTPLIRPLEVPVDVSVSYLSGGGASRIPVKLRAEVQPRYSVTFDDYDDFVFGSAPVKEGIHKSSREEEESGEEAKKPQDRFERLEMTLDKTGGARATFKKIPTIQEPSDLVTELEFQDPNGETQTVSQRIAVWPASRLVGMKPDSWAVSKDSLKVQVAVLSLSGAPLPQSPVRVDIFEKKAFSHRKRIVGGFYGYEHWEETKKVGTLCEGVTDGRGVLECAGKSPVSGNVLLQAVAKDEANREVQSSREVWVAGEEDWWFEAQDHDRMDLIPEKKIYEPGDTATFQVRMPFRDATALVSVEREGVMETFVEPLSGKSPIVKVPLKGNYAPNVFVSVLAVRGRVTEVQPTSLVDLGRPAYKLGIAEVNVGWKAHELKVKVTTDKQVYKVREKATVDVEIKQADGSLPPKGTEIAVAAVDAGLLELMPNNSWKLLDAMMGRRSYEISNTTAQMYVVGRRHFGVKGIPFGGGGGKQSTRELFDTLLFWKARVPVDASGHASVQIPLNDSVTGFKVVAVAMGGADKFGTGGASFRSTQDLMVLPGVAPLIREGDIFQALFTVRNTTDHAMNVDLSGSWTEKEGGKNVTTLGKRKVEIQPGESQEVNWEIKAPDGVTQLGYEVEAREVGGPAVDRVKGTQKAVAAVPVRTYQATLSQLEKTESVTVEIPKEALPGRGGLEISLASSLLGGALAGVKEYMTQYPYSCLEQKVSRAVTLRDPKLWKAVLDELPAYLDEEGLAKYFPSLEKGSDTLTAYLVVMADEMQWEIPDAVLDPMLKGLNGFVNGTVIRSGPLQTADLGLRKLSAMEALSRYEPDPKMIQSVTIQPNLWPTSSVLDWINVLQRVPAIPDAEKRKAEADQILRARLNLQGTVMTFTTDATDQLWWLMVSSDANAARLIVTVLDSPAWKEDMPRIVRGALSRQHRGAWDLTTANAWGTIAIYKFSQAFESTPVSGITSLSLAENREKVFWDELPKTSEKERSDTVLFPWSAGKQDVVLTHVGKGKPWVTLRSLAALPLKQPLFTGYQIEKTWTPVEKKSPNGWSRGDLIRVKVKVKAQAPMTWVVVNDPIPAGSAILGGGLGRDSSLSTRGEKSTGWAWPAYEERSFEAFRAYYEYVPKGEWSLEYTIRLNNPGKFQMPATRVEAMYSPEMFGELPNTEVEVAP